jgi:hypothetical protein
MGSFGWPLARVFEECLIQCNKESKKSNIWQFFCISMPDMALAQPYRAAAPLLMPKLPVFLWRAKRSDPYQIKENAWSHNQKKV